MCLYYEDNYFQLLNLYRKVFLIEMNKNKYAPISFFVYNRPEKTLISLKALEANELSKYSDLFIFSDGAKNDKQDIRNVNEVRKIIKHAKKFNNVEIIEREKNFGLYENFTSGITEICNKFDKVQTVQIMAFYLTLNLL